MNTPTPPPAEVALRLRPSARRLLAVLAAMSEAERAAATNTDLAAAIGTSTAHPRTVSTALATLTRAGLIAVVRVKADPRRHPTGRRIAVRPDAAQEARR